MDLFKKWVLSFCIGLSLLGGVLQAREYESSWFSIEFPDDWKLYELSKIADNNGIGARFVVNDEVMGFEARSSWDTALNVPFLGKTLDQDDSQKKIKEFVIKSVRKYFKNVNFTKFSVVTVDNEPGIEVEWTATLRKKCHLPVAVGQQVYFSRCFIPSHFNWGNYSLLCYSTEWNEDIQGKMASIRNTFRRCKDEKTTQEN